MKISLHIPKEKDLANVKTFIKKEITQARNIKDKTVRKLTISILKKLLWMDYSGFSVYATKDSTQISWYSGNRFIYHCGKEFLEPEREILNS